MSNAPRRFVCLAMLLPSLLAGCGKPEPAERYRAPDQVTDFTVLFGKNCSGCHGMDGQLGPAPPLNDPLFQRIVSDAQLTATITAGRSGTLMPAFAKSAGGSLTDEQVAILVAGIRRQWSPPRREHGEQLPVYELPADDPYLLTDPTERSHYASAGQELFAGACAGCHGAEGSGNSAGALNVPALARLISDQLLRRIIITGRPDLGMPDYQATGSKSVGRPFNSEEINQLAAYVRTLQQGNGTNSTQDADTAPAGD